ncbi:MAG: Nucleoside diphosphate kinase [Alphaproteobacteria bacterium MarineAlpha5_Bin9]|nr:MAG: Nucleoside diphosphate kinase [Alphaproteobacteria bacterium MarineAlpha5_Bin9]|tara:strand:- start:5929 stop:6342 length:414 start_codon:yes stop_codon:yes gene_type:complete
MKNTLSIIKPDATKRNLVDQINKLITTKDLKIVAQKRIKLEPDEAKAFYIVHKDKPFFNDLIKYMTSNEIVVQVLEGVNAIEDYRKIMGATNPEKAEDGTIRKNFAINIQENSVHGSDSEENAKIEIDFFFKNNEVS